MVIVSDNESWVDARPNGRGTGLMVAWEKYKTVCPQAKLVCIDIQPYATTQAVDRRDILNVGGFSDAVFEVIANFADWPVECLALGWRDREDRAVRRK